MGTHRGWLLAIVLAGPIRAERIRIGIESAIWPSSVARESTGTCGEYYGQCASQRVYGHPAAVGATVGYGLPHSFALSAGVLYSRVTHDEVSEIRSISSESSVAAAKTPMNRWTFPILVKYRVTRNVVAPFVAAGLSLDAISNGTMSGSICGYALIAASSYACSPVRSPAPDPARRAIIGGVIGAGIDIRLPIGTLSPELRFTRWVDSHFVGMDAPRTNEGQFVLGLTF